MKKCRDCIYWVKPKEQAAIDKQRGEVWGQCRRYPPTVFAGRNGARHQAFPVTREGIYCGEGVQDHEIHNQNTH